MKTLSMLVLTIALCIPAAVASAQEGADVLSVHLIATEVGPEVRMYEVRDTGDEMPVEPTPVLGLEDFEEFSIQSLDDVEDWFIEAGLVRVPVSGRLSRDGFVRLQQFTRDHVGRKLAIIIDGEIHSVPHIRRPADTRTLPLGVYEPEAGSAVYERLRAAQSR